MIRIRCRTAVCLALPVLLLIGAMSAASAAEFSIWEWWNGTSTPAAPWGTTYATTPIGLWGRMVNPTLHSNANETWQVQPSGYGYWELQVEWAGYQSTNAFGWYRTNAPGTLNELFAGPASPGPPTGSATYHFTTNTTFGFYLQDRHASATNSSLWNTYYSDSNLNGAPTDDTKQVRIFTDPRAHGANEARWILAWEDLNANTGEYANAWNDASNNNYPSVLGMGTSTDNALTWSDGPEPDYQDMIVSFRLSWVENGSGGLVGTPELPSFLLVALSLGAIPVLRRRRR